MDLKRELWWLIGDLARVATIMDVIPVGCLKITENKASDANLADTEVASQSKRRPRILYQTQMSCSNLRREPRSLCQTQWSCCSLRRRPQGHISTLKREPV